MNVLFAATWHPLPPDNGSRQRTHHLLRALAERHDVALATYAPERGAPEAEALVRSGLCRTATFIPGHPFAAPTTARLAGLLSHVPSHLAASQSPAIAASLRRAAGGRTPDVVIASDLPPALAAARIPATARVLELHNFLPAWLAEDGAAQTALAARVRSRLRVAKSLRFERRLYRRFELVTMVSQREVDAAQAAGFAGTRLAAVPNGFDPALLDVPRARANGPCLVYSGAPAYGPNREAVLWFGREILPRVRAAHPAVTLAVTGALDGVDPAPLAALEGVELAGYVDDLPGYLTRQAVCVIPLRSGAGTRIKALEAMALAMPLVTTSKGVEGLDVVDGEHCLVADTAEGFAAAVCRILDDPAWSEAMGCRARAHVATRYGWDRIGRRFVDLVEEVHQAARRRASEPRDD